MKKHPPLEIVAPVVFALVFMFLLIFSRFEPHVEDVDSFYVKAHAGQPGYVLVDVRPEEFFEGKSPMFGVPGGHIPGAVSFPQSELKSTLAPAAALAKAGIVKSNTVILYCNTGTAAGKFADDLIRHFNFKAANLKNYRGGIVDWARYGSNILLPEDHEAGYPEGEGALNLGGK